MTSRHFSESAVVFKPDMACDVVPLTPKLYQHLDERYDQFHRHALIALHNFTADWSTWEIHPHGDEMVFLVSGEIEFLLNTADGVETVLLNSSGSYVIVPKNTWHTARVKHAASCLFMTPGEGTLNADSPAG